MKKHWLLMFALTLNGCNGCATTHKATEKQLRQALADTNLALTQAQMRAEGYQKAAQKYARAYFKLKKHK